MIDRLVSSASSGGMANYSSLEMGSTCYKSISRAITLILCNCLHCDKFTLWTYAAGSFGETGPHDSRSLFPTWKQRSLNGSIWTGNGRLRFQAPFPVPHLEVMVMKIDELNPHWNDATRFISEMTLSRSDQSVTFLGWLTSSGDMGRVGERLGPAITLRRVICSAINTSRDLWITLADIDHAE